MVSIYLNEFGLGPCLTPETRQQQGNFEYCLYFCNGAVPRALSKFVSRAGSAVCCGQSGKYPWGETHFAYLLRLTFLTGQAVTQEQVGR